MPEFIPGLELARRLYAEAVQPILAAAYPDLPYSAALIGPGSEVLGFDTAMSTDHGWGPRLQLFLRPADHAHYAEPITALLRQRLPRTLHGYPVSFLPPTPDEPGTYMPDPAGTGPVQHRVEVHTLRGYVRAYTGLDLGAEVDAPITPADWLTLPAHKLRTLTGGAVFQDAVGLAALRARLAWYPRDVRLYQMAEGWARIGQEEHLMGRAGYVGDALGSALIGARLVRDVLRLAFLIERQYAPYPKWLGTAFARLDCAAQLQPVLTGALQAADWQAREKYLGAAYEVLAGLHNDLDVTPPLATQVRRFHNRPFQVIGGERFVAALDAAIQDPAVRRLADRPHIGSIDQFSDNTDLLEPARWRPALRALYDADGSDAG